MENDLPLIKEIVIEKPPTKYIIPYKKPKYDKDGKLITEQVFYLTSNLFFNKNTSYHIISKIVEETKLWLVEYLKGLPDLEKIRIEFEYHKTTHIDLDNVSFWWRKLLMDILKTPSQKQIDKAKRYKKFVVTTRTLPDDNTKHSASWKEDFFIGEHKMIFRVYGRVANEQTKINLFTNI